MIILRIMGGYGNQMFQYALARELLYRGKTVKADISYYNNIPLGDTQRDSIKTELFDDLPIASDKEIQMFLDKNKKMRWKVMRYVLSNCAGAPVYLQKKSYEYRDELFDRENVYVVGWWQNEKFFIHVKDLIRTEYLKNIAILNEKNKYILQKIHSNINSVSVHVRGGDYYNTVNQEIFGGICGMEYYQKALKFFENKLDNCYFYIFTNDYEYTKKILPTRKNCELIINSEDEGLQDIILMSQCRHHIIANSTFSWWGAWLNPKREKVVVAPAQWSRKGNETPNCEGWIEM